MSKWMSDEEIAEMQRARPLTGNGFVDAYQLKDKAERRVKELEEENEKLRKKVAKLKKRCRALAERGE